MSNENLEELNLRELIKYIIDANSTASKHELFLNLKTIFADNEILDALVKIRGFREKLIFLHKNYGKYEHPTFKEYFKSVLHDIRVCKAKKADESSKEVSLDLSKLFYEEAKINEKESENAKIESYALSFVIFILCCTFAINSPSQECPIINYIKTKNWLNFPSDFFARLPIILALLAILYHSLKTSIVNKQQRFLNRHRAICLDNIVKIREISEDYSTREKMTIETIKSILDPRIGHDKSDSQPINIKIPLDTK